MSTQTDSSLPLLLLLESHFLLLSLSSYKPVLLYFHIAKKKYDCSLRGLFWREKKEPLFFWAVDLLDPADVFGSKGRLIGQPGNKQ